MWHCYVCGLLRLGTLDSFFKLEYIFRTHLKWKDMRITEMVSGAALWGSGAVGMAPAMLGHGMTCTRPALACTKMKLLVNM